MAADEDGCVRLVAADSGRVLRQLCRQPPLATPALSDDGQLVATMGAGDRWVRVDDRRRRQVRLLALAGADGGGAHEDCDWIGFEPGGERLAVHLAGRGVLVGDSGLGGRRCFIDERGASQVAWSPRGRWLAAAGSFGVHILDVDSGQRVVGARGGPLAATPGPVWSAGGDSLAILAAGDDVLVVRGYGRPADDEAIRARLAALAARAKRWARGGPSASPRGASPRDWARRWAWADPLEQGGAASTQVTVGQGRGGSSRVRWD